MPNCKNCNAEIDRNPVGRPRQFCSDVCKDRFRYNTPARQDARERTKERRRETGYHKARYKADIEYQRARALQYYYDNQERILEQKRNNKGRAEEVQAAIDLIRSGHATIEDAYDWMDTKLGFHSAEVENFIVEMIDV